MYLEELIMSKFWESIYCPDFLTVYNPFFLKDMSKALERTVKAVNEREKIVLYGSCNVDGICGISLLLLVLKYLNADVEYYIPDTIEDAYNINSDVVKNHIKSLGAGLIITIGCGLESLEQFEMCLQLGVDLIITDYHTYDFKTDAIVVNPSQDNCLYKFKNLSAVGVAFKLIQAVSMYYDMRGISKFIDLVMLGTVSAGVPLVEENEILVSEGIKHLGRTNNYGIKALLKIHDVSEVSLEEALKLVFAVTPTINAVGKMDNARIAVELFTTSDGYRAEQIAKYLDKEVKNNCVVV
jgi:single-stranded-DNA-specific exonuclease RecJ